MDDGTQARRLCRSRDRAALATLAPEGHPHASLVMCACALDGAPLLLISRLAVHTKNLARDPRASLLFDGTGGHDQPLTGPRVTLWGQIRPCDRPETRTRYLARHPDAAGFAGFADFGFWRMAVAGAHMVAGLGRIISLEAAQFLFPVSDFDESALLSSDLTRQDGGPWAITGIDPDGCDLRQGGHVARRDFAAPVRDTAAARLALEELPT